MWKHENDFRVTNRLYSTREECKYILVDVCNLTLSTINKLPILNPDINFSNKEMF